MTVPPPSPTLFVPIVPGTKGTEAGFKFDLMSFLPMKPNECDDAPPIVDFTSSDCTLYNNNVEFV